MALGGTGAPVSRRGWRNWRPWLLDRDWTFALALAFAVGVVVWFGRSVQDFFVPSAQSVLVPAMVGQTQDDATSECTQLGLRCNVIASQPSDRFPKDVVMSQAPPSGSHVRAGRVVSLVVSTGVTIISMPDLRFESLRNAGLDLNRLRLQLSKTTTIADDDVPANHVVAQDPMPLSSVREGTKVTLTLSKGPPSGVRVPDFTGRSVDDARALAAQSGIHLGQVVWTPFGAGGPPRGVVVRQKPASGEEIDPFDGVSLQVSAGPGEYGYLVRQVHLSARRHGERAHRGPGRDRELERLRRLRAGWAEARLQRHRDRHGRGRHLRRRRVAQYDTDRRRGAESVTQTDTGPRPVSTLPVKLAPSLLAADFAAIAFSP